jgi:hypothetical protein
LVRVLAEHLARPPDEAVRRLVPGRGEHLDERQDLAAREAADRAGLVLEVHA